MSSTKSRPKTAPPKKGTHSRKSSAKLKKTPTKRRLVKQPSRVKPAPPVPSFKTRIEKIKNLYRKQNHQYLLGETLGPDVRCLAVVENQLWVGSRDGTVHIRDAITGNQLGELRFVPHQKGGLDKFYVNAIYPFGDRVYVGDSEGFVHVYKRTKDPANPKLKEQLSAHTGGVKAIIGLADSLWTCSEDFTVIQRNAKTGAFVKKLVGHTSYVYGMCIDPLAGQLWSGAADGIRIWDPTPPPDPEAKGDETASSQSDLTKSRSNPDLNKGLNDTQTLHASADCLHLIKVDKTVVSVRTVGRYVWSGLEDGRIIIWNPLTLKPVKKIKAHNGPVHSMCVIGKDVWTASTDVFIHSWSVETFEQTQSMKLDAQGPGTGLITKGRLRIADMVHHRGRMWLGCRSKGSLHLYRIFHWAQHERVPNIKPTPEKEPTPPPSPSPPASDKGSESGLTKEERLRLTIQQLVDLWNNKQTDPLKNLQAAEPPTDKEGVFLLGTRKLRLVAMDGEVMVRVGGGYVTIDQFVLQNAAFFRHLARSKTATALNKLGKKMSSASLFSAGSIDTDAISNAPSGAPTPKKKRPLKKAMTSVDLQAAKGRLSGPGVIRGHHHAQSQQIVSDRSFSAKRSKDGKTVEITEEIVLDASKLLETQQELKACKDKTSKLSEQLKQEKEFSTKLLQAMSASNDVALDAIRAADPALGIEVDKRLAAMKKAASRPKTGMKRSKSKPNISKRK